MENTKYFDKLYYKFKDELYMEAAFWVSKPYFVAAHVHNCIEIGCCLSGSGEFIFSKKRYSVEAGDIFIVNQLEPHVCRSGEDDPANFIFLFISPSMIEEFDPVLMVPFIYKPESFENKIPSGTKPAQRIYDLVNEIYMEIKKQDLSYISLVKSLLTQMCVQITRHYSARSQGADVNLFYSFEKIREVTEYIQNNLDSELSLAGIAKTFYLSESRLRHLFGEALGVRFKDYVNHCRIETAKRLIANTNQSIDEVCEKCGFQSISSFYRVFSKTTGYSPMKYRECVASNESVPIINT